MYAAVARRRRERYAGRPDLRRRLRRPVISVGNLAVGGRGKTPMVATITRLLLEMGERPAILSRGYARTQHEDGVVVVRDAAGIRTDLGRAGDEPLMLARQLEGAAVLVCDERYLAGRVAEHHLGATVHVLDDGFQHLQLDRDVDILLIGRDDIAHPATLPGGRLREPLDTLVAADAIVAVDDDVQIDLRGLDIPIFRSVRTLDPVTGFTGGSSSESIPVDGSSPMAALAGIASPDRFFDDLRAAGHTICATFPFADHHPYTRRDLARVFERAAAAGAAAVVTTEKDFVRLLPHRPFSMPVGWVALTMAPDPLPEFRRWLADAVAAARDMIPSSSLRSVGAATRRESPEPRV
jgi:tetraacyldisaccharide 4'-kinase